MTVRPPTGSYEETEGGKQQVITLQKINKTTNIGKGEGRDSVVSEYGATLSGVRLTQENAKRRHSNNGGKTKKKSTLKR